VRIINPRKVEAKVKKSTEGRSSLTPLGIISKRTYGALLVVTMFL